MEKIPLKILRILFIAGVFLIPAISHAADLGFFPSTVSRTVGNTFVISVFVSSPVAAINGASGVVSFPTNTLEVVSVSKTNSVMNLWVQEPSFSNAQGTINFEGITLNPGFTGNQGTVIAITFRAKSAGVAALTFNSGSILANDGAGTNVLKNLGSANFSIQSGTTEVSETISTTPVSAGTGPTITSTTHPDKAKWYSNNTPEFSWQLPEGALEARTLIGKSSSGVPTVRYSPPISRKKVDALPDGTYYFSLQIRTDEGWGEIGRYRVNIDTTPPSPFTVTFPHGNKGWEPQPVILFNTTDNESGISKYDVKIGNGGPERVAPLATSNPYPLPLQFPGTHTVTVTAIDEAGNTRTASEDFTIESIDAPIITYYHEEIESGDIIKIRGTTYPNSDVTVYFRDKNEVITEEFTKSNVSGDFAVVATKRLDPGVYTFTARVKDGRGAQSQETSPLTIVVNSRFLAELTELVLNYLSVAILIILALAALVGGGAYAWYHSLGLVRRLRRESREAEKVLEKSFTILRKDIAVHVAKLKAVKRKLTAEEVEFLEQFEEELGEAEEAIAKEIKNVSHS